MFVVVCLLLCVDCCLLNVVYCWFRFLVVRRCLLCAVCCLCCAVCCLLACCFLLVVCCCGVLFVVCCSLFALRCLLFVVGCGLVSVVARSCFASYVCLFAIVLLLPCLGFVVVSGTLIVDRCMMLVVCYLSRAVRCSSLLFVVGCFWCLLLLVV